jgi:hypothetical protein
MVISGDSGAGAEMQDAPVVNVNHSFTANTEASAELCMVLFAAAVGCRRS